MTTHLVTFSDESMSRSAVLCANSAADNGTDFQWLWTPDVLRDTAIYKANQPLFDQPRGYGFWAWKPFIVHSLLVNVTQPYLLKDGDVIVYADAGIEFTNNVNHIIDRMDQDIFLFGNQWEHAHWCKRDIVDEIFSAEKLPDFTHWALPVPWRFFGKQVQASVIFFRVSGYTRKFVKEWLDWCLFEGGRLIDDSPSIFPNHLEFRENRHDQAIVTTMAYRDGIKLHWWPAQYNDGAFIYERGDYPDEGYPVIVHHHRRRNHEWVAASIGNLADSLKHFNDAINKAAVT